MLSILSLLVLSLNRPMRVPPLSLVVISFPEIRRGVWRRATKGTGPAAEPSTTTIRLTTNREMLAPVAKRSKYRHVISVTVSEGTPHGQNVRGMVPLNGTV
jgi:hypothetical protein